MKTYLITSVRFFIFITLVFGVFYTVFITGVGQLVFPYQTNGSQLIVDHKVKGTKLMNQSFSGKKYFKGREATVSQLAPFSTEQKELIEKRTNELLKENPNQTNVPIDLVTASASGVDPDISLASAEFQINRISEARELSKEKIRAIIKKNTQKDFLSTREFVNVMTLNLALDRMN